MSKRLAAIADMLSPGGIVADVGCDHGFLDLYLVQTGKMDGAIAMDARKGPLAAATEHVRQAGLSDQIETRLSDGLEAFTAGEAKSLVCAGMGGPLMQRILTAYPEKTESFEEFLLQPQSELREFRVFLRENGYKLIEERIVFEDGKYYFPMKARLAKGQSEAEEECRELYDRYGELLIRRKDPILFQYLKEQERILGTILEQLRASGEAEDKASEGAELEKPDGAEGKAGPEKLDGTEEGAAFNRRMRLREVEMEWEMLQRTMSLMK